MSWLLLRGVCLIATEQHPRNSCVLIGERYGRFVLAAPFDQPPHPLATSVCLEPDPPKCGPGAMDEQLPQIAIAPFANPEQAGLAPGGVLPWYQPQPRRKLAPILEMVASLTAATSAVAVRGPMPGIVPRR